MDKFYLTIRKITVAPIIAVVMLTVFFILIPEIFQSAFMYVLSLFCLGVLPLLAYPIQKHIPSYKNKGRDGQRTLTLPNLPLDGIK